jgi:hypothetical protein
MVYKQEVRKVMNHTEQITVEPIETRTAKEEFVESLREITRPITFDEIAEVLSSTIKCDVDSKTILFCACLLTFTEEDQLTILMSGDSASGKSYIAREVCSYFPSNIVREIASASPTAFMHECGEQSRDGNVRVNLEKVILLFFDQPHYSLIEKLRPLLSHDRRELLYKITDKTTSGGNRTKNVIIRGYPTVIFSSAKLDLNDQERTRAVILSPETDHKKNCETIRSRIQWDSDRETFRKN